MSWVAFLRAVNVGGRTVKMDRLRAVFEALRFGDVSTFIASGNVRFTSRGEGAALEKRIERALAEAFGFEITTFLRSTTDLAALADDGPFDAASGSTVIVGFLKSTPAAAAVARLATLQTPDDELRVLGREVWWRRRGGIGETKLAGGLLERTLGVPMTMRNITTVRKLARLPEGRA